MKSRHELGCGLVYLLVDVMPRQLFTLPLASNLDDYEATFETLEGLSVGFLRSRFVDVCS